jgi:hypothetical protein
MKEYINENDEKRLASELEGTDWLDIAYREAIKEIDDIVRGDIFNKACNYVTKPSTPYTKEELIQNIQKLRNDLPKPPTIQETIMWQRHMLKRMAINAGKTEEEMMQYLQELDKNPPSTVETPADPIGYHLKNLKKDNKNENS